MGAINRYLRLIIQWVMTMDLNEDEWIIEIGIGGGTNAQRHLLSCEWTIRGHD